MKEKPDSSDNKQRADSLHDDAENAYEVEEQVFVRQNYDNTSMFEMDIEKAKVIASSSNKVREPSVDTNSSLVQHAELDERERNAIKRSLAELREIEQQKQVSFAEEQSNETGILGKLKRLFSDKE